MCIYIYIYIYNVLSYNIIYIASGQQIHTRNHKSEHPLENATEKPSDHSSKHPLTSDNPSENTTGKLIPLEHTTDNPLKHATENPRWFLRCRFLVCNLLPVE